MKRFRRWLFDGAAAISLLLCLATVAVWGRVRWTQFMATTSCFWMDGLTQRAIGVTADDGRIYFISLRLVPPENSEGGRFGLFMVPPATWRLWNYTSFDSNPRYSWHIHRRTIGVRLGLLTAIFTCLPATWIGIRFRKSLIIKPGHCANCGYDLRVTPDRCPECGHLPEKVKSTP